MQAAITAGALALVLAGFGYVLLRAGRRREHGTSLDQATYRALHTVARASPPLRGGLTSAGAARAAKHLRSLLGTASISLTDLDTPLAWDGACDHYAPSAAFYARTAMAEGRTVVIGPDTVWADPDCPIRHAVVAPLRTDRRVVGALLAFTSGEPAAGLVRAVEEVASFVSSQLELAELDQSRTRLVEADLRALRAQISPHFIYNSLTAVASFIRTDPERARELLLEFAEFTRYSFRRHGDFTTLAEEIHSIQRYLTLEQARFGDRLNVTLRIAPEVLSVAVPFLCLQPLVENAVKHGLEGKAGGGHIVILAEDAGTECLLSVEDDGVGMDPDVVRRTLAGLQVGESIGLANVDERLRTVFGDEHGLVIETSLGGGTKINLRIPKYRSGVRAS